jgi:hypothetical protein
VKTSTRITIITGFVVALLLAGIVSFYASSEPDGLNKVAADKGFNQHEKTHDADDSPFAGYATHGVSNGRISGGLAGVVGVVITFGIGGAVAYALRRRGGQSGSPDTPAATTALVADVESGGTST